MTRVTIRQTAPAGPALTLDLVDLVDLSGGVGGWDTITRPRNTAAVEWTGTPARTQVLPLMLDGTEVQPGVDTSVEPQIAVLASWGRELAGNDEPPVLSLAGPLPATDGRWVLQDLAWGAAIRDSAGSRVQQAITVTLLEYQPAKIVSSPAKKAQAKKKGQDKSKGGSKDKGTKTGFGSGK